MGWLIPLHTSAQYSCTNPEVPTGVNLVQVGSNVGVPTLSDAISFGLMAAPISSWNYGDWPEQKIFVSGQFVIDNVGSHYVLGSETQPNTPGNALIIMDVGARIAVDCGAMHFVISGNNIRGCTEMWNSIRIFPNVNFILSATRVFDGDNALQVLPGARVQIRQSLFEDNLIGIRFLDGDHSSTFFACRASSFVGGTGSLISSRPDYFDTPYAGIIFYNKPNVNTLGANVFDGVQNGILAYNTCLFPSTQPHFWSTNVFQNIHPAQATDDASFGNAILIQQSCAVNSLSNLHGHSGYGGFGYYGQSFTRNFSNCLRGIVLDNANAFIFENDMIDCDTAILVKNTMPTTGVAKPLIFENDIDNSRDVAMCFIRNAPGYKCDIYDNTIDLNSPVVSRGIYVNADGFSHNMRIFNRNIIDMYSTGTGIELDLVENVQVFDENELNAQSNNFNYTGVLLNLAHGTGVKNNYFTGFDQGFEDPNTQFRVGLDVIDSDFTFADCNVFENMATSMSHKSYNVGTLIRSNIFRSGVDGYSLGSPLTGGAVIEEQSQGMIGNENEWPILTTGDFYTNWDARSFNLLFIQNAQSKFWVDQDDSGFNYPYWPDKIQAVGNTWFEADLDVIMSGATNCTAFLAPDPTSELTGIDQGLLQETLDLGNDYFNWRARWGFLAKQDANPDLMNVTGVSAWRSAELQTPLGQLYTIATSMQNGMYLDPLDAGILDSLSALNATDFTTLAVLDSVFDATGSLGIGDLQTYTSTIGNILDRIDQEKDLLDDHRVQLYTLTQGLLNQLSQTNTTGVFDTQLKLVLGIQLERLAPGAGTLDSAQWTTLETLAASCRYVDGIAVPMARSILRARGVATGYGDHPSCTGTIQEEADLRIGVEQTGNWMVVPSTTRDLVTVYHSDQTEEEFSIDVFSANGQPIRQYGPFSGSQQLDFGAWPSGLYLVRIKQPNQPVSVHRITRM